MADWEYLNRYRCTEPSRRVPKQYCTTLAYGFNGMFRLPIDGKTIRCLASDGLGWRHVSVSIEDEGKPPSWKIMCIVKDLFWEDNAWVIQFHPPKKDYVNHHPGCLHLWEYIGDPEFKMPTPSPEMVGPRGSGTSRGHFGGNG